MPRHPHAALTLAISLGLAACSTLDPESRAPAEPNPTQHIAAQESPADVHTPPPPPVEPKPRRLHVALRDPAQLGDLETRGFALSELVLGLDGVTTTQELNATLGFGSIFATLRADLGDVRRVNPEARVTAVDGRRLFDADWLDSDEMFFTLTGVFNRIDRRDFGTPTPDTACGEIRFLYRLAYRTTSGDAPMTSRLPMTLNVVFHTNGSDDPDCTTLAEGWNAPEHLTDDALTAWLLEHGALNPTSRARWTLKSVETNLQTLRWQSSIHPSLAGHVEYLMRVFQPSTPDAFTPAPLENTPDVARLNRTPAHRDALLELLRDPETLAQLDQGTLTLPSEYLGTRALATASRGLARLANRPFLQLFDPDDFADLDLSGYTTISSPKALLRRLDAATCMGCHQSRAIAGFHHLGDEPHDPHAVAALHSGSSANLKGELQRRHAYVQALIDASTPDTSRPFPELQGAGRGGNAPCGLGDPGFADWTCAPGFTCTALEDPDVGTCLVPNASGNPCEYGTLKTRTTPHKDRVRDLQVHACGPDQACSTNLGAFPQGMCSSACDDNDPDTVCGQFPDIDGFQKCLRQGGEHAQCEAEFAYDSGLPACDDENPCRPDYVCVQTADAERGGCIPTYFVFQLRTDGYPLKH